MLTNAFLFSTAPSQPQQLHRHRPAAVDHDAETALEHGVEFCRYRHRHRHFGARYDDDNSDEWDGDGDGGDGRQVSTTHHALCTMHNFTMKGSSMCGSDFCFCKQ